MVRLDSMFGMRTPDGEDELGENMFRRDASQIHIAELEMKLAECTTEKIRLRCECSETAEAHGLLLVDRNTYKVALRLACEDVDISVRLYPIPELWLTTHDPKLLQGPQIMSMNEVVARYIERARKE